MEKNLELFLHNDIILFKIQYYIYKLWCLWIQKFYIFLEKKKIIRKKTPQKNLHYFCI